jgi:hypothetical protein
MAAFSTTGPAGSYTLTIVNILRSLYTFDPTNSMLSATISTRTWPVR